MVIFCLRGAGAEPSRGFPEEPLNLPEKKRVGFTLPKIMTKIWHWPLKNVELYMNHGFELHCTCKPYESWCQFQVAMVNSWPHGLFLYCLQLKLSNMWKHTYMIIYASHSLHEGPSQKNNSWFIAAYACGFARLRAPAKHWRNAFAPKVGTALLSKSLHPKKSLAHLGFSNTRISSNYMATDSTK